MKIEGLNSLQKINTNNVVQDRQTNDGLNFGEFLEQAIKGVNELQNEVDQSRQLLAMGKVDNLHTVMIDADKASIAVQFTIQVRNKVMEAYNEIMRMQL